MTIAPGEEILASDLLGRFRVGTAYEDTDSATFTGTLTAIATCVATLVSGRTYRVKLVTHIGASATEAAATANVQIREDTVTGTELQGTTAVPVPTNTTPGFYVQIETDYTAVASGNKTFVGGAQRNGGVTALLRREAAATRPTILTVDYAYG